MPGRQSRQADFRVKVQSVEQKLQSEENEVARLKDELEKKGMLMKPEQRQDLQDDYVAKAKDFERNYKDSKDELSTRIRKYTGMIIHDLAEVIRNVGEKDGYTMVFEKGSILWGTPGIDITDQVIRTYNGMHVKIGSLGGGVGAVAGGPPGGDQDDQQAGASSPGDFGSNAAKHSSIS